MIVHIYNKENQFCKLLNVAKITTKYYSPNIVDQPDLYYLFIEPDASYIILVDDVLNINIYDSEVVYNLLTNHTIQKPSLLFK